MADIQAQLADGTILSFPDGTPDTVINAAVKKFINEQPVPTLPGEEQRTVGSRVTDIQQFEGRQAAQAQEESGFLAGVGRLGEAIAEPFGTAEDPTAQLDVTFQGLLEHFGLEDKPEDAQNSFLLSLPKDILQGGVAALAVGGSGIQSLFNATGQIVEEVTGAPREEITEFINQSALFLGGQVPAGALPKIRVTKQRKVVETPLTKKQIKAAAPTEEVLRSEANAAYKAAENEGVSFKPAGVQKLIKTAEKKVGRINEKLHPDTRAAFDEVIALGEKEVVTLTELEEVRKIIGDATQSIKRPDARLARLLRDSVDEFVLKVKPSQVNAGNSRKGGEQLTKARDLWQRLRKSEVVTKAINDAGLAANPGARSIRNQFAAILRNEKKSRLFNREELSAMEKVAKGNTGEQVLDILSKFSPQNALTSIIGSGGGAAVVGVPGAVGAPIAGQIARSSAAAIKKSNADFVQALVRSGVNRKRANRSVVIKNRLEALGTFGSEAAENIARMMAFGVVEGKTNDQ